MKIDVDKSKIVVVRKHQRTNLDKVIVNGWRKWKRWRYLKYIGMMISVYGATEVIMPHRSKEGRKIWMTLGNRNK